MILKRLYAGLITIFVLLALMRQSSLGVDPDPEKLRAMIDLYCSQITSRLELVSSVEYDVEIHQKLEPKFAAWRVKAIPATADYVDCVFNSHISLKNDLYRWKTIGKSSTNGNVMENTQGGWSGVYAQHMINDTEALLMLSKLPKTPAAFIGKNSLFLPYSFLVPDADEFNKTACTLQRVKSKAAWEAFKAAIKGISLGKCGDRECLVVTVQYKPEVSMVVYFPINPNSPPLGLDYYAMNFKGHDRVLTYQYRVGGVTDDKRVFPIPYALTAGTTAFMAIDVNPTLSEDKNAEILKLNPDHQGAVHVGQTEHRISGIKINSIEDDSIFTIDPTSANKIYDVDQQKVIVVPR